VADISRRWSSEIGIGLLPEGWKVVPFRDAVSIESGQVPDFSGICSADMYPLQPLDRSLHREFLYFWLLTGEFTKQAVSHQSGIGIPKINRRQLESTLLPVPPLYEQIAIVHVLRTVQRAKEATASDAHRQ
jgi:hypothetical protein